MTKTSLITGSISLILAGVLAVKYFYFTQEKPPAPVAAAISFDPETPTNPKAMPMSSVTESSPSVDAAQPEPTLPKSEAALTDRDTSVKARLADEVIEYEYTSSVEQSVDERFAAEAYDTSWAAEVENATWEEFYAAGLPNSDIEDVQCRSSVCKIAVSHQDAEAEETFKHTLLVSLQGRSGYFENHLSENGERSTILYRYR